MELLFIDYIEKKVILSEKILYSLILIFLSHSTSQFVIFTSIYLLQIYCNYLKSHIQRNHITFVANVDTVSVSSIHFFKLNLKHFSPCTRQVQKCGQFYIDNQFPLYQHTYSTCIFIKYVDLKCLFCMFVPFT